MTENTSPYMLCADLHAHSWSQFATIGADGVNSRLNHLLLELGRMEAYAHSVGIAHAVIAGDVFHWRGDIKPEVFNPLMRFLGATQLHWSIMPGNHDITSRDANWLHSAVSELPTGKLISKVSTCHDVEFDHSLGVILVPWVEKKEDLAARIQRIVDAFDKASLHERSDYDLVLHTGIDGVLPMGRVGGWHPDELSAYGFRRVFAGHYHNHKVLGTKGDVISIGSVTQQTWRDVDTLAGWMAVWPDRFEFHESAMPKFVDFKDASHLPRCAGNFVRVSGMVLTEREIADLRSMLIDAGAAGVIMDVAPKSTVVTRSGVSPSKAVTIEASIRIFLDNAKTENADAIEAECITILDEIR